MISLSNWDLHCRGEKPLFYGVCGKVMDVSMSIPVAYDKTLESWVLCMATHDITFNEIFETRKECAEHMIEELKKEYCI